MRNGLISENIYNRSVKRIIDKYNKDIKKGTGCQADCAFLCIKGYELTDREDLWELETELAVRDIISEAAVAGKPAVLQADITIPEECGEEGIRRMIGGFVLAAGRYRVFIGGAAVRVSAHVKNAVYSLVINGKPYAFSSDRPVSASEDKDENPAKKTERNKKSGERSIIMIGRAGSLGSAYLANRYQEIFSGKFSKSYVRKMLELPKPLDPKELDEALRGTVKNEDCDISEAESVSEPDISLFPVGEGGIFAALWNMGCSCRSGFEVNLKSIPVFQECIEVCDIIDINIYMLFGGDCLLAVTDRPEQTVEKLDAAGIEAAVIGRLTDNNDRVIINNDERRFLGKPEQDEIYRAVEKLEKKQ